MLTRRFVPTPRIAVAVIVLSIAGPVAAADAGYLFRPANGSLPESDQQAIYAILNLETSPDGAGFTFKDLECPAFLFDVPAQSGGCDHLPWRISDRTIRFRTLHPNPAA